MDVLERGTQLAALQESLDAARRGDGRLVWVQGEAGIGKSTLVDRFCSGVRGARLVVGRCDPLETPRPLGPALDIAERLGVEGVGGGDVSREVLFRSFLDELASWSWVTVAVIEDAHWADEATLDLIRFVGRRLQTVRALVIVTFRDDEIGPTHPLRTVVGDLATSAGVSRLELGALSRAAVAALAAGRPGTGDVDVGALHAQTGGNPFFVTEVLAVGVGSVPGTVRDAVLARAARLSPRARRALDAAAVPPTRAETWLVRALADVDDAALDECVAGGMLRPASPGTVGFRHELARRAIDEAVPPARRAALHAAVAELLCDRHGDQVDATRVAHHAEQAGNAALACHYATRAAVRAADLGAHREAAAQYKRALDHAEGLGDAELADLLAGYAREARATDRVAAALEATARVVALRRSLGEPRALGKAMRFHAGALWDSGRSAEATAVNRDAIRTLEALEPGPELADAYGQAAAFAMLARDRPATMAWGERALALAERFGTACTLAGTMNSLGASRIVSGDPSGAGDLRRSIAIAEEAGSDVLVSRGWLNLGSGAGEVRDYDQAEDALRRGIPFAADRDLDAHQHYMTAWLARVRFERGDWTEAESLIGSLHLTERVASPVTRIVAWGTLGRLHARRGDLEAGVVLEQAWRLATETGDLQRLWPIAAARAEAAWLAGDTASLAWLVDEVFALGYERGHAWAVGALGLWRHRRGIGGPLPDIAAEPYALHVAGRLTDAADRWEALGCPYEAADALADSPATSDLLRGLTIFDELGAVVPAARVRRKLRDRGLRGVPRGPRSATAASPAGLTPRQAEVLELVAAGLSDADIAARLHLSPKTVGHHVSAVLSKLGVTSRGEAAHRARVLASAESTAPT